MYLKLLPKDSLIMSFKEVRSNRKGYSYSFVGLTTEAVLM